MNIQIDKCQLFEHTFISLNVGLAGYLSLRGPLLALLVPTFELQRWQKLPGVRLNLKLSKFQGDTMIN